MTVRNDTTNSLNSSTFEFHYTISRDATFVLAPTSSTWFVTFLLVGVVAVGFLYVRSFGFGL